MRKETIFHLSEQEQHAYSLPKSCDEFDEFSPDSSLLRSHPLPLPEISEINLTRHFAGLARKNMGIDTNFYPLGSCTMKLNPRVNELAASLPGFTRVHPLAADEFAQGSLQVIHDLIEMLCQVCGMTAGTMNSNAGAQGEFTGIHLIKAYHAERGDHLRDEVLIPDNAHGTNPATAAMAGFKIITIKTNEKGDLDLDSLKKMLSNRTAALMQTNPNTLGLFSPNILEVSRLVHEAGGLLFYDGANLNATLNIARPGDMGFDCMHINLHKTFSTPHGGGGPGSGPVLCNDRLKPYLPLPRVVKDGAKFKTVWHDDRSIGHISSFRGNFGIYLRAYLYAKLHGHYGLRKISEMAVLNANYLKEHFKKWFTIPFPQPCSHEFVVQADSYVDQGIRALDIAKRLLDYGIHAPTIYFPLIIKECLLIEPTESESKRTLDHLIEVMEKIIEEIETDPEIVKSAPHTTELSRMDEVKAAKDPQLTVNFDECGLLKEHLLQI
jgi:glycine dehydrogenase subunit 2